MNSRRITQAMLFVLIVLLPLGTRFIWQTGVIDGVTVEPGTISLFGTQILAVLYVLAVLAGRGREAFVRAWRRPPVILAAALAFVALISVSQSGDKAFSLLVASWVILGALLFAAVLADRPPSVTYLSALVAGAALQAVLGAWQFFSQSSPAAKWLGMAAHEPSWPGVFVIETTAGRWLRAYGTLGHPNVFGFYVVLGILACFGLILVAGRQRGREPLLALVPLLACGLFFSFSRGAVLALLAAFAGYLLLTARPHATRVAPAAWLAVLALLAAFLSLGVIYREPALTRASGQGRLEWRSWNERRTLTADALKLVSRHTALGVGAGEMPSAVWRELADGRTGWKYQEVHNLPLLVLVDVGAVGLILWLLFVAAVCLSVFSSIRSGNAAAAVPAALLIAALTAGLFDHFLWSSWTGQLMFWLVCGLALSELDKGTAGTLQ